VIVTSNGVPGATSNARSVVAVVIAADGKAISHDTDDGAGAGMDPSVQPVSHATTPHAFDHRMRESMTRDRVRAMLPG